MERGKEYYRDVRDRKIKHKKDLCRKIYGFDWYRNHDGQYSKGKIHCSCMMCTYDKRMGLKTHEDKIEELRFKDQLKEI